MFGVLGLRVSSLGFGDEVPEFTVFRVQDLLV